MKKHVRSHNNRRRKKTVAQRKAAYARCVTAMRPGEKQFLMELDEKQFLMGALQPFHDTIVRALIPLYRDIFEGDDPANDPPEETVGYAVDLISDATYDGFDDDAYVHSPAALRGLCAVFHGLKYLAPIVSKVKRSE
jgi:hypothetical protein